MSGDKITNKIIEKFESREDLIKAKLECWADLGITFISKEDLNNHFYESSVNEVKIILRNSCKIKCN